MNDRKTIRRPVEQIPIGSIEFRATHEAGTDSDRIIRLSGDSVRIGSHPHNDLVVTDPLVSRFHCVLSHDGRGRWTIRDSESLNGTYLNGVRIRDADVPRSEATLTVGDSTFAIRQLKSTGNAEVSSLTSFGALYGESTCMRRVFALLSRIAQSEATVLIEGESGTGKELAADAIVMNGPRRDGPFVIVDCGAIAPSLIESELFGHARGAFTGADRAREGAFEAASGGTIFLDEIGELPIDMQPKLLRALEKREIRRAGETHPRKVDVRVIAATNKNLGAEVNRGNFREDLFYRLSVVTVAMPPLRDRPDDLPGLIREALNAMDVSDASHLFDASALEQLKRHNWPGNVRELRNYVERSVVLQAITPARSSSHTVSTSDVTLVDTDVPFRTAKARLVAAFELTYLSRLMEWSDGNVSKAARKAEIDRMHLHRLLQRHQLRRG